MVRASERGAYTQRGEVQYTFFFLLEKDQMFYFFIIEIKITWGNHMGRGESLHVHYFIPFFKIYFYLFYFIFGLLSFPGPHSRHMEVPRLGV